MRVGSVDGIENRPRRVVLSTQPAKTRDLEGFVDVDSVDGICFPSGVLIRQTYTVRQCSRLGALWELWWNLGAL